MRDHSREMWYRDYMLMMDEEDEDYGFIDDSESDDYEYDDIEVILSEDAGSPEEGFWYMNTLDELEKIGRAELVLDEDELESMIPGPETDEAVLWFYDKMESVIADAYLEEDQTVESELTDAKCYDEDELTIPKEFLKLKDYKSPDDTEPVKKLKRDLRLEALRRLEQSARTTADFRYITECYDVLEANARRRERYHEILRSGDDLSFESGASEDGTNLPYFMSDIIRRQMLRGDFLDYLYCKPCMLDQLVTTDYLIHFMRGIEPEYRHLFYWKVLERVSNSDIAEMKGQTARGVREKWKTLEHHLKQRTMGVLIFRSDKGYSFTGDEQHFFEACREQYEFRLESEPELDG